MPAVAHCARQKAYTSTCKQLGRTCVGNDPCVRGLLHLIWPKMVFSVSAPDKGIRLLITLILSTIEGQWRFLATLIRSLIRCNRPPKLRTQDPLLCLKTTPAAKLPQQCLARTWGLAEVSQQLQRHGQQSCHQRLIQEWVPPLTPMVSYQPVITPQVPARRYKCVASL
jgi:hypothetical protein